VSSACCVSPSPLTPAALATITKNDDAFFAKRDAWITAFAKTSFNPAALPQDETDGSEMAGPTTFSEALANADAVIEGTVQRLHFTIHGTFADFLPSAVDKSDGTVKVGKTVSVEFGFVLQPDDDFTQATLAYGFGDPVLLPGDRALLLVSKDPKSRQLGAGTGYQAFAETNTGAIISPPGSATFSAQINGRTLADLTPTG